MDIDYDYDSEDNSDCDDYDCPSDSPSRYYDKLASGHHTNPFYPRPQLKIIDVSTQGSLTWQTNASFTSAGLVYCLNDDITSGTGLNQMTGNQVTFKSISWNFLVPLVAAVPAARLAIVWDRQPNGSIATYSDIYAVDVPSVALNLYAHQNPLNRQRFVILKKFVYPNPLNASGNYETGKLSLNMVSTYNDLDTTVTVPVQTGALLFVGAASANLNVNGRFRLRYYDN